MSASITDVWDNYVTNPALASRLFHKLPSLYFYPRMLSTVFRASRKAKRDRFSDQEWVKSCTEIVSHLERVGCRFEIRGKQNFLQLREPCVFVANHMSTLETFILGAIIGAHRQVTFVVKESLVRYPVFRHIMISRDPVVVSRKNPREDFKVVMEEGQKRLQQGVSVVVFPQSERSKILDTQQFNSIGVKLAKKAGLPIVPLALKTDAWENGRIIKDFGKIHPKRQIYFEFAPVMRVQGGGRAEHQEIVRFIADRLERWQEYQG